MIDLLLTLALLGHPSQNSIQLSDEPVQTLAAPDHPSVDALKVVEVVAQANRPAGGSMRFNMTQNGKKMTADDFDAWMKANGIRIIPAKKQLPVDAGQKEQ